MIVYLKYAVTWVFFMAIIVGLCLITPKLAKKIDKWREEKKAKAKDDDWLQPFEQEQQPTTPTDVPDETPTDPQENKE